MNYYKQGNLTKLFVRVFFAIGMVFFLPAYAEEYRLGVSDNSVLGHDMGAEIQALLDRAYKNGGGSVYLGPGIFGITRPLILRSGVHLIGSGIGSTTIQPLTDDLIDKVVDGAGVWASIGVIAAKNVSIRDLTLDHKTNKTIDNGIAILPSGSNFDGIPSENVVVERVSVLGTPTPHSYLIWNFRGRGVKIMSNYVDGGVSAYDNKSNQEGIESYGGKDVLLFGNTVRNVGNACINVGSAGGADTGARGIIISNNYTESCGVALNIGTAMDEKYGAQNTESALIVSNVFRKSHEVGIHVSAAAKTENKDLRIAMNSISEVGPGKNGGVGISIHGAYDKGDYEPTGYVSIDSNSISGMKGHNAQAIRLIHYSNINITNNAIRESEHIGIFSIASQRVFINGNHISDVGFQAIALHGQSNDSLLTNNYFNNWGRRAKTSSVLIENIDQVKIANNH